MLRWLLNFHKISHRFTSSFVNPSFQYLNGSHIRPMYWNMIILNPSRFKVEPPLKILIFLHWTLRPTFTTLLGRRRAISHWMGVPKNRGNVNRPPYRYTAVTHWACPPSSDICYDKFEKKFAIVTICCHTST